MNAYFGETWDAPATEGQPRVPTPVGLRCFWCDTPIVEGDRGFLIPCMRETLPGDCGRPSADLTAWHRECLMHSTVGGSAHLDGNCTCHGGDHGGRPQTPVEMRAEAIEVWDRITSGRF